MADDFGLLSAGKSFGQTAEWSADCRHVLTLTTKATSLGGPQRAVQIRVPDRERQVRGRRRLIEASALDQPSAPSKTLWLPSRHLQSLSTNVLQRSS